MCRSGTKRDFYFQDRRNKHFSIWIFNRDFLLMQKVGFGPIKLSEERDPGIVSQKRISIRLHSEMKNLKTLKNIFLGRSILMENGPLNL